MREGGEREKSWKFCRETIKQVCWRSKVGEIYGPDGFVSVKWSGDDGTVPRDMQLWLDASQTLLDCRSDPMLRPLGSQRKGGELLGEGRGTGRISRQKLDSSFQSVLV